MALAIAASSMNLTATEPVRDYPMETYIDIAKGIAGFEYQGEESFYRWTTRIIDHRFVGQVRPLGTRSETPPATSSGAGAFVYMRRRSHTALNESKELDRENR